MNGAQAVVKALEEQKIPVVFGYPGATVCPLYDALAQSAIRHILVRQEQNAGHAASGWARMSGRPGVCIATSGPGATNLITALATAYMDSVPLVAITGQVASDLLGRDVFQEADITGAVAPFIKYAYLVKEAADLPRVMREAFLLAGTGRPGPVLVDIPVDVLRREFVWSDPGQPQIRGYRPPCKGHQGQVRRVAQALEEARRPLLCAGGGVFASPGGVEQLRALAEECSLPVVTTMMGLGALPTGHPLCLGMLGMHGCARANRAVSRADLLIIVGARVGDRAVGALSVKDTRIVHIDIDPAEIGKNIGTAIPLVGDAAAVLAQLRELGPRTHCEGWMEELREPIPLPPRKGSGLDPRALFAVLSRCLDKDAVFLADVGQNQIWAANGLAIREGRFLTSGGMGTMGYAIPAALGAKLAVPGRQVAAVCGDGAFQMTMNELATSVQHRIPLKLIVINNHTLGMVREIQTNSYGDRRFGVELGTVPDIPAIAAAYGIPARRITGDGELEEGVRWLLEGEGSALLECVVDPEEASH